MLAANVEKLGIYPFKPAFRPYRTPPLKRVLIFGLDTEWVHENGSNKLLCWQLSLSEAHTEIYTEPLTWDNLYSRSVDMAQSAGIKIRDISTFVYGVFWATAEAQWLLRPDDVPFDGKLKIGRISSHQAHVRYWPRARRSMYLYDISVWTSSGGLKSLARTFGLEKGIFDTTNLHRDAIHDPAFIEYARHDAYIVGEILRRLRDKVIKVSHVDVLRTRTPAGTAASDFRRRYIEQRIIKYRTVKVFSKRKRRIVSRQVPVYATVKQTNCAARRHAMYASHGGRRECFYRGELPIVYEYDAKSAYPSSAIRLEVLPLREHLHRYRGRMDEWVNARGAWGMVSFEFPADVNYPCLPVDTEEGIVYPRRGISWCTNFEVRVAISMGAKVDVWDGWYYNEGVSWMSDYQSELVRLRRETDDETLNAIYKLMGNSLIGKLAQHRMGYDLGDILIASRRHNIPTCIMDEMIGLEELGVRTTYNMGSVFMPEWYCLILGWFRANISSLLATVGDVVQVATDAIFVTSYLGESFDHDGITYELVDSGTYVGYRSGLYRVNESMRYHGCRSQVAESILNRYIAGIPWVEYQDTRIRTLRQAMQGLGVYGQEYTLSRRVSLMFDGKRVMVSGGDTGWTLPVDTDTQFVRWRRVHARCYSS